MKSGLIAALVVASSVALAAQWLGQTTPGIPRTADGKPNLAAPAPRTQDGKPDLSGLWAKSSVKYARNVAADLKPEDLRPSTRDTVNAAGKTSAKTGCRCGACRSARPTPPPATARARR